MSAIPKTKLTPAEYLARERTAEFKSEYLNGEIFATHDTCTHGQASLADGFVVDDEFIECPLHQGTFDIRTGRAAGAPCKVDIRTYQTKVEDGKVFIKA